MNLSQSIMELYLAECLQIYQFRDMEYQVISPIMSCDWVLTTVFILRKDA